MTNLFFYFYCRMFSHHKSKCTLRCVCQGFNCSGKVLFGFCTVKIGMELWGKLYTPSSNQMHFELTCATYLTLFLSVVNSLLHNYFTVKCNIKLGRENLLTVQVIFLQ